MKKCATCGEEKSLEDFHKQSRSKDGRQRVCKECNTASVKRWQKDNPERYAEYYKSRDAIYSADSRKRAKKYGMTPEELSEFLLSTDGVCTICGRHPNNWLVVDHCHKTGKVRGVLCEKCNQALGLMDDNAEYLESAIAYLKANA